MKHIYEAYLAYKPANLSVFPLSVSVATEGPQAGKKIVIPPGSWQVPREYSEEEWSAEKINAIGLITGRVNNIIVIDIDHTDSLRYLSDLGVPDDVMETRAVLTRSNFIHLIYYLPENVTPLLDNEGHIPNGAHIRINGQVTDIDVRADGGFVIAPPTVLPDGTGYRVHRPGFPMKPLPEYWVNILTHVDIPVAPVSLSSEIAKDADEQLAHPDPDRRSRFVSQMRVLAQSARDLPAGTRSETDFAMACYGLRAGLPVTEIRAVIMHASSKAIKPGEGDHYVTRTMERAVEAVRALYLKVKELLASSPPLDNTLINLGSSRISATKIWRMEVVGPKTNPKISYAIDYWLLQQHMEANRIFIAYYHENPILVQENGKIVDKLMDLREFYSNYLKHLCKNGYASEIEEIPGQDPRRYDYGPSLYHEIVDAGGLSPHKILGLNVDDLDLDTDSKDEIKLYFTDFWVSISKNNFSRHDYADLPHHIYRSSIIPHPANIDQDPGDITDFVMKLCEGNPDRFLEMQTALGYLISRYVSPHMMRMICFVDQNIDLAPQGGTGKSLFSSFVSQVRPAEAILIDGKGFDPENRFSWQTVTAQVRTIIIDDIKRNFDFESLFHVVTGGMTIEEKFKKSVKLPKDCTPKLAATTNYSVTNIGASSNRRIAEYEITPYFSATRTPLDVYGRLFFDWDDAGWAKFFGFMVGCCQKYIEHGLKIPTVYAMLGQRKLLDGTCSEWIDFCDNFIEKNTWYPTEQVVQQFDWEYKHVSDRLKLSNQLIHLWLERYANANVLTLETERMKFPDGVGARHVIALANGLMPKENFKKCHSLAKIPTPVDVDKILEKL